MAPLFRRRYSRNVLILRELTRIGTPVGGVDPVFLCKSIIPGRLFLCLCKSIILMVLDRAARSLYKRNRRGGVTPDVIGSPDFRVGKSRSPGVWTLMAVSECRKKPGHSTGVPKPDLAPVQTAAGFPPQSTQNRRALGTPGLGMTPGGMWPRSGGAAGFPPQNPHNRRVLGTPWFGMTTKGAWSKTGGLRLTTGGVSPGSGSAATVFCARVICNVIWKVNAGQYAYDVGNGTPVEKLMGEQEVARTKIVHHYLATKWSWLIRSSSESLRSHLRKAQARPELQTKAGTRKY
jgi:hypothetical protein